MLLDLRQRLEFGLLLAIVSLIRLMPVDMAAELSARVWQFIAPRTRRHRRALKNIEKALPEKTPAEREAIALGMWDNLGRVMAETMLLDRILRDPSRMQFENPALIARYTGKLGAAVFTGLHMGNWELGMYGLNLAGARPAAVYRIIENPYVDRYVRRLRADLYPGGLFASKGDDGLETVMRVAGYLRKGGVLGILSDLVEWNGIAVPFFGHPMYATPAPAWLARRAGVTCWAGCIVRIGKQSRFKIIFKELKVPRTDNPDEDIKTLTADIQKTFEGWIRQHPEQWMWSNKRWRDHELPGGKQY